MTTTTDQATTVDTPLTVPSHPSFCDGGLACEAPQHAPAEWEHRGQVTTWHVSGRRLSLALVRCDGYSPRKGGHQRGDVEVELTIVDTEVCDAEGNLPEISLLLHTEQLSQLSSFLEQYGTEVARQDEAPEGLYDMPSDQLPKRDGRTKAQEIWDAVAIGSLAARAGQRTPVLGGGSL